MKNLNDLNANMYLKKKNMKNLNVNIYYILYLKKKRRKKRAPTNGMGGSNGNLGDPNKPK